MPSKNQAQQEEEESKVQDSKIVQAQASVAFAQNSGEEQLSTDMATPSPGATKTTKKKKKKKDSTKNADGESATIKKKKVAESPGKTPLLKVIPSPKPSPGLPQGIHNAPQSSAVAVQQNF